MSAKINSNEINFHLSYSSADVFAFPNIRQSRYQGVVYLSGAARGNMSIELARIVKCYLMTRARKSVDPERFHAIVTLERTDNCTFGFLR